MKKTLLAIRALMSVPKDNPGLVKAQYIALARQLPMMYFILLVNTLMLAGTHCGRTALAGGLLPVAHDAVRRGSCGGVDTHAQAGA